MFENLPTSLKAIALAAWETTCRSIDSVEILVILSIDRKRFGTETVIHQRTSQIGGPNSNRNRKTEDDMGTLQLKGKVVHIPGPWGANVPVYPANIEIIDLDLGNPGDSIWTGTTNQNGEFQGTSSEWKDRIPVKVWKPKPTWKNPAAGEWITAGYEDDPMDIILLQAKVRQDNKETTLPFAFAGDRVMSPSLIVPWGPPSQVIGKVNGIEVSTPDELNLHVKQAVDAQVSPIQIEIYGENAEALMPVALPSDQLRQWLLHRYGLQNVSAVSETVLILMAIAAICLSVGAAIALVILALAVLYAVHKNYGKIGADMSVTPEGRVVFKITLEKS